MTTTPDNGVALFNLRNLNPSNGNYCYETKQQEQQQLTSRGRSKTLLGQEGRLLTRAINQPMGNFEYNLGVALIFIQAEDN